MPLDDMVCLDSLGAKQEEAIWLTPFDARNLQNVVVTLLLNNAYNICLLFSFSSICVGGLVVAFWNGGSPAVYAKHLQIYGV